MERPNFLAGLSAAAIVLAGPAFVVLALSDRGSWTSVPERIVLSAPLGIFVFTALGYAVASSLFTDRPNWKRIALCALGTFLIPAVTYFIFWPIFFAAGVDNAHFTAAVLFVVLTLPVSAFQATVLEERDRLLVFCAGAFAAIAAVTIGAWPLAGWTSGHQTVGYPIRLFGDAPYLISAIPYAAIAFCRAKPLPLSRFGLALVWILAPIYLFKALCELPSSGISRAVLWPVQTATEFVSWPDRLAIRKELDARIRSGIPVQIGGQWYRFKNILSVNLSLMRSRNPYRIDRLQITVPPLDVELEPLVAARLYAILNIGELRGALPDIGPWRVGERYDDLFISVNLMRDIVVDAAATRARLRRFMEEAKTVPPAK